MDFGAHLPLMDFGGNPFTLDHLGRYTRTARDLGSASVAVNDHMIFEVPWLDGPTALAAVMEHTGEMSLATTVALPIVRGPIVVAKALAAIDRLSGGRVVAGVGPGSSAQDYATVGVDFAERWPRFDEAIMALRAYWRPEADPFEGRFYSTVGTTLDPPPVASVGPPIWVGSWGSDAGLRRVARLSDGWLASAYNTTPELFAVARDRLGDELAAVGKDSDAFPNGLATMWFYITEDRAESERVIAERVAPAVKRPQEMLRERLPIGSAERFAEKLTAFAQAGVQRVYLWPVADELRQLELFHERVRPLLHL